MKQNNPILIGLTGGIATGKSTVSKLLSQKGFCIIDADKIARIVVEKGKPAYFKIINYFSKDILFKNSDIDRKALGKVIFNDESSRQALNNIVHPYVFEEMKEQIEYLSLNNKIIFLDVPLLFEQYDLWKEYSVEFDEIWLVYCNKDIQIERLMDRDNISKSQAMKRIDSQMSLDEKRRMSSKIINNSQDIIYLKEQVDELLKRYDLGGVYFEK